MPYLLPFLTKTAEIRDTVQDHSIKRLSDLSYYRTGGTAHAIHQPRSQSELADCMTDISRSGLPFFILGAGSNSLVMDDPWPGHVISLASMQKIEVKDCHSEHQLVWCQAGVENSDLVRYCQNLGLGELAWMYRLPGQIGGTTRMNARCYGGEIGDFVTSIYSVAPNGKPYTFALDTGKRGQIFRGYKDTLFMRNHHIIAAVEFRLKYTDQQQSLAKMLSCERDREGKGQFLFPSCGCVFKNDYSIGIPSGMLLERAGVHQLQHPRIEVNPKHANFVFNRNLASSHEILEFTFQMQELVYQKFGVWLHYEMEVLGHLPSTLGRRLREVRQHRNPQNSYALQALRAEFQNR